MELKTPYFGTHIDLGNTLKYEDLTGFDTYVKRISVQIADTTDKLIMDAITRIAIAEGITDVYVLDKQNIVTALKKQIPQKPKGDGCFCPVCGEDVLMNVTNYCCICGQALDWNEVQEE